MVAIIVVPRQFSWMRQDATLMLNHLITNAMQCRSNALPQKEAVSHAALRVHLSNVRPSFRSAGHAKPAGHLSRLCV
jgi:hypothetical protein